MQFRKSLTYKKAGVDISKAHIFSQKIASLVKKYFRDPNLLSEIGGFAGLYRFPKEKYKNPLIVSSCDGVGTKLKIAQYLNIHQTVGIDLVAMNVNDIISLGAKPVFFLDYIACGKLHLETLVSIVKAISKACKEAECNLLGGETAEMPGMYEKEEYDLAGFCVGFVERDRVINGSRTKPTDIALGLASNGLHSNGFSLVRKIFSKKEIKTYSKELLKPTKIYVRAILSLEDNIYSALKGIAHISGGAFYEKLPRIIPDGLSLIIKRDTWPIPRIFKIIQEKANIKEQEMYRTFNMGIGMVIILDKNFVKKAQDILKKFFIRSWIIGEIKKGKEKIHLV